MSVAFIIVLLTLTSFSSSQAPRRFGPGGIYPCRCKGSDTHPSNCDQNTGMCPASVGQECVDGSQYGISTTGYCQIVNIALTKPANQTTTYRPADLAVDGKPYEQWSDGSCTHTLNHGDCSRSPVAWWQVDLGEERNISAVWLLNRKDLLHRLANIVVKVSNDSRNWQTCYSFTPAAGLWTRRLCSRPLQGRYVRVEKTRCSTRPELSRHPDPVLTLCELMVVDQIYIAASVAQLTSTSIDIHTNESFYAEQFSYTVTLIDRGSHSCSTTQQITHPLFLVTGNIIMLNPLTALWDYTVHIQPVWNQANYGPPTSFNFTTLGAAPSRPPSNLRVTDITSSTATVHWHHLTCDAWGGRTRGYRIDILGTNYRNISLQQNTATLSLTSLRPYTTFQASIQSANEFGTSNWLRVNFTTAPDRPTEPRNVSVVSYTERSIEVRWTAPVKYHGLPGIYIVSYKGTSSSFSRIENTANTQIVLQGLPSGEIFEVLVYASTIGAGVGPASAPVKQHTKPPIPAKFNIAWTSADLKITVHLPPAGQNRYLKGYLILVDEEDSTNRTRRSLNTYCTNASSSAYISANITNIPHSGLHFTVGNNVISGGVWNRPLSAMNYTIYVIAVNGFESDESYRCISEEVTVSALQSAPSDPGVSGSKTGAIAGGSASTVVALSIVAVVVVLIIRRRRRQQEETEASNDDGYENMNPGTNDVGSTDEIHIYMQIENPTEPDSGIKISEFKEYIRENKAMNRFKDKFERLPMKVEKSTTVGQAQWNKGKNRFQNSLPYDENRVVLKDTKSDYINASRINGYDANQKFIATQAPGDKTKGDFLQMIWQENIQEIVMLNKVENNGRGSCTQYWPETGEQAVKAGEYAIRTQSVTQRRWYTLRELLVSKKNNKRRVVQYHFTSWPDKEVPKLGVGLLQIRDQLKYRDRSKPLLVHCRTGVGRTGTFIALDILLSQTTFVNIDQCINLLRNQRMNMVQVKEEYEFLHELLLESFTPRCQPISEAEATCWMSSESYQEDLTELLDILAVTTLNNTSSTDDRTDEGQKNAPRTLSVGYPATYTLHLIGFHSTSSQSIQSDLLSQCINTSPDLVLLICSSQQTFLSTAAGNIESTKMYGNVRVNQSIASLLTPDLSRSRISIDICTEEDTERVYQNSTKLTSSWRGKLLRLNTPAINVPNVVPSLLKVLNEFGQTSKIAVLHDNTAHELLGCVCLTASTVSTITQHHELDVYSAAKELILKHNLSISRNSVEAVLEAARLHMQDNNEYETPINN